MGTRNWSVRALDERVIDRLKTKAMLYGCPIGQLLAMDYDVDLKPEFNNSCNIHHFNQNTIEGIRDKAKELNISVADYLAKIHRFYIKGCEKQESQKQKINDVKRKLKINFNSSLKELDEL